VLSVLWYVRHIVVNVMMRKTNMSDVSQPWQQYVIRFTAVTTICHTFHITNVWHIAVSVVIRKTYCCQCCDTYDILLSVLWYVRYNASQHWQQYILRITTLTAMCFTHHSTDNDISYVFVDIVVIRKRYCC
jgi:transposase-like protein